MTKHLCYLFIILLLLTELSAKASTTYFGRRGIFPWMSLHSPN